MDDEDDGNKASMRPRHKAAEYRVYKSFAVCPQPKLQ